MWDPEETRQITKREFFDACDMAYIQGLKDALQFLDEFGHENYKMLINKLITHKEELPTFDGAKKMFDEREKDSFKIQYD